ncbi:MAG: tetratricopeptide repeat protein [Acidobacteria bacterium]|nr:tetratricopeptide repeat protein [Acidobacteriota bacterium]
MNLAATTANPEDALSRVHIQPRALQDFRSLTQCLEWELSELHWNRAGILTFIESDVPFVINNTGRLSEHAAAVLFANCAEFDDGGPIIVLELGAGTGLFAKYFLDVFRSICQQEHRDFYDRLLYLASDRSTRTVEQWHERGQFDDHIAAGCLHVELGVCDALDPGTFRPLSGPSRELSNLRAVFCNYILDVLPATVLRNGNQGPEELQIRTHLTNDRELLNQYTKLTVDQIRELAWADAAAEKAQLIPLMSLLEFETAFVPITELPPHSTEALAYGKDLDRVVLNHGAIQCLSACSELLGAAGFVLWNDYGSVQRDQIAGHAATQRFGPTSALGLNFPYLEYYFTSKGRCVAKPEEDQGRSIHARLLLADPMPNSISAFQNRFGPAGSDFFDAPLEDARKHAAAGRKNDALESYRIALSRSLRDWQVAGEIAEFVGLQLQDYRAGRDLAMAAVELNPWYSPWLWNILGDVLFLDGRINDAHEAYLQAYRIHPGDPRTNLNLAYTYFEFGQHGAALEAVAVALAADVRGLYRQRLLEKQHQILGAISGRWLGEQERLARRAERML